MGYMLLIEVLRSTNNNVQPRHTRNAEIRPDDDGWGKIYSFMPSMFLIHLIFVIFNTFANDIGDGRRWNHPRRIYPEGRGHWDPEISVSRSRVRFFFLSLGGSSRGIVAAIQCHGPPKVRVGASLNVIRLPREKERAEMEAGEEKQREIWSSPGNGRSGERSWEDGLENASKFTLGHNLYSLGGVYFWNGPQLADVQTRMKKTQIGFTKVRKQNWPQSNLA